MSKFPLIFPIVSPSQGNSEIDYQWLSCCKVTGRHRQSPIIVFGRRNVNCSLVELTMILRCTQLPSICLNLPTELWRSEGKRISLFLWRGGRALRYWLCLWGVAFQLDVGDFEGWEISLIGRDDSTLGLIAVCRLLTFLPISQPLRSGCRSGTGLRASQLSFYWSTAVWQLFFSTIFYLISFLTAK